MRLVSESAIQERRRKGRCIAWGCCAKARKGTEKLCSKHFHVERKERDPAAYSYYLLRGNARRRGKEFTLTLAEFREFCSRTGYLDACGRFSNNLHIDRRDPRLGYTADNIQVMQASENVRKRFLDDRTLAAIESGEMPEPERWHGPDNFGEASVVTEDAPF